MARALISQRAAKPLRHLAAGAFLCTLFSLSGCTVVAVGAATVGIAASAVGVAADVAVGTAKLAGKGVGAAYGAMADDKPDNSGLSIKYRESDPNRPWRPGPGMSNTRDADASEPQPAAAPQPPAPRPAAQSVEPPVMTP
ncbi:MAG: hypothetical protein RSD57_11850 [Comamonas sp.]